QVGTERFGHVGRILDGVVQRQLVHSVKTLMAAELVEVERQGRLGVVYRAKTARGALEVNSDSRVELVGLGDGGRDVGPGVTPESGEVGRRDLDAQVGNDAVGEELVRLLQPGAGGESGAD